MFTDVLKNITISKDLCWQVCVALCLTAVIMMMPEMVYATTTTTSGSDPISETICTIVGQLTGPVGRAIATIAVFFVGIGLFLGKMSWGLAIAVGIGIGAIFGAAQIVSLLDSSGTEACA